MACLSRPGQPVYITGAHIVQIFADGRAAEVRSASGADLREETGAGHAHLRGSAQDIRLLRFEKWAPLLGDLNRAREWNAPRLIAQLADRFQRRGIAATPRIEIESNGARELQLRDAVVITRADQVRVLIRKRDLRLQHIETRDGAGFESVLLILQLALEQVNRFFLHADERAVEQDLIELLSHRRDHGIDRIPKTEISAVALEIGRPDLRDDAAAGEKNLRGLYADVVTALDCFEAAAESLSGSRIDLRSRAAVAGKIIQMRIGAGERTGDVDARKDVRAQFDIKALGPLDFLARALDIGIALQRGQNRLLQRETRHTGADLVVITTRKKRAVGNEREKNDEDKKRTEKLSHGVNGEARETVSGRPA